MKKIGLIIVAVVISLLIFVGKTNSQLQPYYSGDAINFENKVIVATTNSGKLEIFKLENNSLVKTMEVTNVSPVFNTNIDYSDVKLSLENGQLYAYAVSEYTLYKYNISSLTSAQQEKKVKNNFWEWYYRVDRMGDNIVTVSAKGVKVYNSNLDIIDAFNFTASDSYSVRSNDNSQYIFAIDNNKIEIYDRNSRLIVHEIPLNFVYANNNHKVYFDTLRNEIFAVDDTAAKKFDFNGNQLASFQHLDQPGYDVDSSYGNPYFYFSNGMGVVKINKDTFKVADYAFTTDNGGPQGWAMGLKVVDTNNGDVVIVFNGSNILALDSNLKKIDSVKSTFNNATESATENLFLNLSSNSSSVNNPITVSGGGFWAQEPLLITFGNAGFSATTDSSGRFSTSITTPSLNNGIYDIKVTGVNSTRTYSTTIQIK